MKADRQCEGSGQPIASGLVQPKCPICYRNVQPQGQDRRTPAHYPSVKPLGPKPQPWKAKRGRKQAGGSE